MTCSHRFDIAPYTLGTLDPAERSEFAEHLLDCAECQGVLESVAGLPGLLARVDAAALERLDAVPDGGPRLPDQRARTDGADEAMFRRLLARSAQEPPAPRSTRFRPARWLAAAAAAAVLATGAGFAVHSWATPDPSRIVAAAAGPVHATVRITAAGSGTSLRLDVSGVPAEQQCRLVAVDRTGHRTVAATWEAGYTGTASFSGSLSTPMDDLASLRLETDAGTLVTFPLT